MTPQTGNVGSQVILSINYDKPQPPGNYKVLWSKFQLFDDKDTRLIKEGVISNGTTLITAQITVPESVYGIHFVQFKPDNGSNFTNFQFTVLPRLQVMPSSALSGDVVSVYGTGFPANDIAIFNIDSQFLNLYVPTTETGSFTGQIVMPTMLAGSHKLTAVTQLVSHSCSTTLEILPAVNKSADTNQEKQDTKTTILNDSARDNSIVNEPERDKIAPPLPTPISPLGNRIGIIGSQPVTIQWSKVNDRSGVTYAIEINENYNFLPGRSIQESGLTNNYYTAVLKPGIYYWRVKAIDHEENESNWSYAPYGFKVGELSIVIDDFAEILNNNGEIVMIAICCLGALIILVAGVSSIRSLTKPKKK